MMFEDLEAWQQARHLVNEVYSLTRENSSLSKDDPMKISTFLQ